LYPFYCFLRIAFFHLSQQVKLPSRTPVSSFGTQANLLCRPLIFSFRTPYLPLAQQVKLSSRTPVSSFGTQANLLFRPLIFSFRTAYLPLAQQVKLSSRTHAFLNTLSLHLGPQENLLLRSFILSSRTPLSFESHPSPFFSHATKFAHTPTLTFFSPSTYTNCHTPLIQLFSTPPTLYILHTLSPHVYHFVICIFSQHKCTSPSLAIS